MMKQRVYLEKKYNLVKDMLLGDINPKKTEDPREAIRAISRRNLNSVVVISIGSRMTQSVFKEFKVSFKSPARRESFFRWLDSAADMWLNANRN